MPTRRCSEDDIQLVMRALSAHVRGCPTGGQNDTGCGRCRRFRSAAIRILADLYRAGRLAGGKQEARPRPN